MTTTASPPTTGFRSRILRQLAHALTAELRRERDLTLRVAVMQAHGWPRTRIVEELGCTDVELRAALARLEACRDEHVDYKTMMEEE